MLVTLIGRPGCHLCDDARSVIEEVLVEVRMDGRAIDFEELSILDDRGLRDRYAEEIPVILIDGAQHTYWKVDRERFRSAIG